MQDGDARVCIKSYAAVITREPVVVYNDGAASVSPYCDLSYANESTSLSRRSWDWTLAGFKESSLPHGSDLGCGSSRSGVPER